MRTEEGQGELVGLGGPENTDTASGRVVSAVSVTGPYHPHTQPSVGTKSACVIILNLRRMFFFQLQSFSMYVLPPPQVLGTLFIYVLFMVEEFRKEPVENMDDVIYYVNGTYRLLEFLVALCVVAYGVSETIFGEWTVMGSMIIFIHSYYNVWLRAQLGWKSFLLRRDAVTKIKSLPIATKEQLEKHNDICAICYQVTCSVGVCWIGQVG